MVAVEMHMSQEFGKGMLEFLTKEKRIDFVLFAGCCLCLLERVEYNRI